MGAVGSHQSPRKETVVLISRRPAPRPVETITLELHRLLGARRKPGQSFEDAARHLVLLPDAEVGEKSAVELRECCRGAPSFWLNGTVVAVVGVPLLRTTTPPLTTWDDLLPAQATRLPAELARIDASLDDERFIAPWRTSFSATLGRPSVPIPTLLRLLYPKHRYQLGYQSLCREVADSIAWRRFCRIPPDRPVPHPTTLRQAGRPLRPNGSRAAQPRAAGQARR